MRYTGILAISLSVVLFVACGNNAPALEGPLEGAWQVVDVRFGNDRDDGTLRAQPGQFIFTPTRYAAVWVTQTEPRTQSVSHFQPTTDEIIGTTDPLPRTVARTKCQALESRSGQLSLNYRTLLGAS